MAEAFDPATTCHDCGGAPIWEWSQELGGVSYCQGCYRKSGNRYTATIDLLRLPGETVRLLLDLERKHGR